MIDEPLREDRQKLYDEYQGVKTHIGWSWLNYTRYRKADPLLKTLQDRKEDIKQLTVIDYGAGVGDYGFVFGREGAKVVFYDFEEQINFVKYRVEKEPIKAEFLVAGPTPLPIVDATLVIFGEVLEHVEDPFAILSYLAEKGTKYIYTSSYPFRSDDPNDGYWQKGGHGHPGLAQAQKPCRELLAKYYTSVKYDGEARLFIRL